MWDFRRSVPKTGTRKRGQVGDQTTCQYMIAWNNVAYHHSQCSHSLIWHPFENEVSFPCPLPQPHWGYFMSLEMEHFWPSSTGPNVPPGCNGCCMPRHYSWTLQGWIRHTTRFFPRCLAREDIRCDVDEKEHVAKHRRPGRLDYINL